MRLRSALFSLLLLSLFVCPVFAAAKAGCDLITAPEVADAMGAPGVTGAPLTSPLMGKACVFTDKNGILVSLTADLPPGSSAASYIDDLKAQRMYTVEVVNGVGEEAVFITTPQHRVFLAAKAHGTVLKLFLGDGPEELTPAPKAGMIRTMKLALTRI